MGPVGRDARLGSELRPVDANRRLHELAAAQRDLHEADRLQGRLKSIEFDRVQFVLRLNALCERLDGREPKPMDPASLQITVDGLMRRINEAKLLDRELTKWRPRLRSRPRPSRRSGIGVC